MLEIVKTNSLDVDFHQLIVELDKDLTDRYGELQKQYDKHNKIDYINDVVLIYKDKVPVACGGFKEFDADTIELKRIFVLKEHRKQGLSKLVVDTLEEVAENKGYTYAVLETGVKQHEAISLYNKTGYIVVENYGPYIGDLNSVCMRKVLKVQHTTDIEAILSHRHDNGADLWTTSDKRLIKGSPYSTLESVMYLLELGMKPTDALLQDATSLIFSTWQEDGRFKLYPQGAIYPCQTIHAANVLCHLGYASDVRLQKTFQHLLDTQYIDGGWRCNKFSYGHGPETEYSNPFPTLSALNAFRFSDYLNKEPLLDKAVEFLLEHWLIRKPIGPCQYGIGSLFMQVEYPFRNYNLFVYVYVLSFYNKAKEDKRFLEALKTLESKMVDGQIVVERIVPKLSELSFCKKGKKSVLATKRYHEILQNLQKKVQAN